VLEACGELLGPGHCPRGALPGTRGDRLDRGDELPHPVFRDIGETVLEGAHAITHPIDVLAEADGETVQQGVEPLGQPLLGGTDERDDLPLDPPADLHEAPLDPYTQALRLIDQALPSVRKDVL